MADFLSVFGIDWKLLIAQGVNFLILLIGLSYFLYRPVLKLLSQREKTIADGVKSAEEAKQAQAKTEEMRSGVLAEAHKQAEEVVTRAHDEGKRERSEIVGSAQKRADAALQDARMQAEELQRQALLQSEKEIARLAVLAAEKVLQSK